MKLITKYQLERLYTYTRTDCYALMIGDSPKKNETIRFDETVCFCVTMIKQWLC